MMSKEVWEELKIKELHNQVMFLFTQVRVLRDEIEKLKQERQV